MKDKLTDIIAAFSGQKILVVGEAMLDVYLAGNASRICREAPVPIVDVEEVRFVPGGAANTALNLAQLGAEVEYLTVIGNDHEGELLRDSLVSRGVDVSLILGDTGRRTITKQRVAAGDHLLVRFDAGSVEDISAEHEAEIIRLLRRRFHQADAVVISDYGYGVLTDRVIAELARLQSELPAVLVVDAKSLDKYRGVHAAAAKPNYQELATLLAITDPAPAGGRAAQLAGYSYAVLDVTGADYVAATIDREGSLIFQKGKKPYRTFSEPVANSKAAGAGDTYVSALALALAAGAPIEQAAELAQAAARVILGKTGTAACSQAELIDYFSHDAKYVADWQDLRRRVRQLRQEGKRIVFTNGCFDILHSGHVSYLARAKSLGDVLVLALNSDDSIKRLKGPERPINSLEERAHVMAGLESVDLVTSFGQDTPADLIRTLQPDVFAKGGDYTPDTLPEAPLVRQLGGRVEIVPFVNGRSTSRVIGKIKSLAGTS